MDYNEINELKSIKSGLIKELIEQGKQNGKLEHIDTYAHAIKNLCKIIESAEEETDYGYSGAPYGMMKAPRYSGTPYMANDYSWTGTPYAGNDYSWRGRDSMGRYSSHGDFKSALYEAMNHASNDMERQQVQDLINRMG